METRHFIKTLCKQKVKIFFLSTLIALKSKWVPRLSLKFPYIFAWRYWLRAPKRRYNLGNVILIIQEPRLLFVFKIIITISFILIRKVFTSHDNFLSSKTYLEDVLRCLGDQKMFAELSLLYKILKTVPSCPNEFYTTLWKIELQYILPFYLSYLTNFIKKETLARVFLCEFSEISKNTFSYRTIPVAASVHGLFIIVLYTWARVKFCQPWNLSGIQ